ncbi:ribonuclease activity regulator RraA [Lentibacter algarum]|uniref:RraA family protein n=1 Tax=Lentibacter algarum TaxID=576131 RepID=UPI001C0A089C|nr:ribonuclease activity regulator RraA [Lentibacter algarum]MBU2983708.1 ribonuclease activity regulator RraA [Lentibacter algarum]
MSENTSSVLTAEIKSKLARVTTASISSQLQARGYLNCVMNKLKPLQENQRMIGIAHTLRYLPVRPDLNQWHIRDVQRETVEAIKPGEILVIDARNEPDAGTVGDIYALRVTKLGGEGVITDGAIRDTPAIKKLGVPVYHQASNSSTLGRRHAAVDSQIPIACGGAAVVPGDVIVGDGEGAIVIPIAMVEEIADAALAMEIEEEFVITRIAVGGSTVDYFPLTEEKRAEYEEWLAAKEAAE